jgi:hypothetical protein
METWALLIVRRRPKIHVMPNRHVRESVPKIMFLENKKMRCRSEEVHEQFFLLFPISYFKASYLVLFPDCFT